MEAAGQGTDAGHRAAPGGSSVGTAQVQVVSNAQHGAGGPLLRPSGVSPLPSSSAWIAGGLDTPAQGFFYDRNAPGVIHGAPVAARGMTWSASPVSQGEEGTDTVLSWQDDPRRRDVRPVGAVGQAPAVYPRSGGVVPVGADCARGPAAVPTARYTASSVPAAFSGSSGGTVAPAARVGVPPRRPPMELSFVPLRSTAPASSSALDSPNELADVQPTRVADGPRVAASAAVPPTGRRAPGASRSRSPSPKRRQSLSARGAPAAGHAATPLTLESFAAVVSSNFKNIDGKLGKIQKSVDGVSAVVSTHADKFNSMAVLAESVTAAQSATATAVAEMRAVSEKTMAVARGANAGTSQKSSKMGAQEQRARDLQQANAVKVSFLGECCLVCTREHWRRPLNRT